MLEIKNHAAVELDLPVNGGGHILRIRGDINVSNYTQLSFNKSSAIYELFMIDTCIMYVAQLSCIELKRCRYLVY